MAGFSFIIEAGHSFRKNTYLMPQSLHRERLTRRYQSVAPKCPSMSVTPNRGPQPFFLTTAPGIHNTYCWGSLWPVRAGIGGQGWFRPSGESIHMEEPQGPSGEGRGPGLHSWGEGQPGQDTQLEQTEPGPRLVDAGQASSRTKLCSKLLAS